MQRVLIVFDMITRWLRESGYKVTYVRNITDIDDKIIKKAILEKVDYKVITENFIKEMDHDAEQLGIIPPTLEPKATDHIEEMIKMIENLISKGFAIKLIITMSFMRSLNLRIMENYPENLLKI